MSIDSNKRYLPRKHHWRRKVLTNSVIVSILAVSTPKRYNMKMRSTILLSLFMIMVFLPVSLMAGELDEAMKDSEKNPHFLNALDLYLADSIDEAIAEYAKAIEVEPDSAYIHNFLGHALMKKGETDKAIARYKKAIELKPSYAYAHNNLGVALMGKGDIDGAIKEFEEAIRFDQMHALAARNLQKARKMKKKQK